jgi:hypothetical protein
MLTIIGKYEINKEFAIKTFLSTDLTPKEKKRFREVVEEVQLSHQIAGEDIPSLVNEEYDCQVILFFNVKLAELKSASFVGNIMQKTVKSLCVVRFYDHTNQEVYCFSHKRLSLQDRTQIVIEDTVYSTPASVQFRDEIKAQIKDYVDYEKIQNRGNKLDFYLEAMIKTYIISNLTLWSGSKLLLASGIWYYRDKMLKIYAHLKRAELLKKEQKSAISISENSKINAELKRLYAEVTNIVGG